MFITDDSLLSALRAMAEQEYLEDQPGYTSALQRDLEGPVGSLSVSRVGRRVRRSVWNYPVSNVVPDGTKLQQQCITTDMYILQTVL
jgi:hypothetical protein